MPSDFIASVNAMLGPPRNSPPLAGTWDPLEGELGIQLPDDFKTITDRYAPLQLNLHLFLCHPATPRWNLGAWMRDVMEDFRRSNLREAECPGFPDGPVFGAPSGLIPLVDTDRGEYAFGVMNASTKEWLILTCNGDEPDFYEYRMSFGEWLYRYLSGEDMFGPDSAVFYPGPVALESMPMTTSERATRWYGPDRGM
ncbi:SMI1/KNR4 family protein [Streptomyces griseorubiginosus]|uniref:SMI1/KNR4 family protein n=1 Tax=Streptomyces griseorubiginosus TaxID=67304 RepID=UPI0036A3759E